MNPSVPTHPSEPDALWTPERTVLVLLPVFNGAAFLGAQLDSLLAQTGVRVLLLCRDDGSVDASSNILQRYVAMHPLQVQLLTDNLGNLGASGNFSRLMQAALDHIPAALGGHKPRYLALCDQDDWWHPNKLSTGLEHLQQLEAAHPNQPALVHSDLRVIAENGEEIAPSMARFQGLRPQLSSLSAQVLSNTLTGCTSLMNRALLERSLPVPAEAIMHDWWLSLVASALGTRRYVDQALIDYRQHAANAIGAKAQTEPVIYRTFIHRLFDDRHGEIFRLNARQSRAFLQRYRSELSMRQRACLWLASHLDTPFPPLQRLTYRVLRRL